MVDEKEKEKKARFSITMSPEVVKRIDEERMNIPRSTFIEYKLTESIGGLKEVSESMKASKEKKQAGRQTGSS